MLKDTPRSRMWESCLSGSERGLGTTMARLLESLSYSKMYRILNFIPLIRLSCLKFNWKGINYWSVK